MKFTSEITDNSVFKVMMFDANIIIPYIDKKHDDSSDVEAELNRLYALDIDFYYSQPCLLEILNYWRIKWLFNACLLLKRNAHNLPKSFYGIISNAETEFNTGTRDKYLYDHEVKKIRTALSSRPELWARLIGTLNGKMASIQTELKKINVTYAKFNSPIYPLEDKDNWPKWETAYSFIEKYGLASNDAAILNMTVYKTIHGFVSNDGDLEFAVTQGAYDPNKFFGV
jgi:predicted nucleic acid-binding protein